jgi:hypothetical protein
MRYRMDGEDYLTMRDLLAGPVRKRHSAARVCFIEDGHLIVICTDGVEHRYRVTRESTSLSVITTP